ncbi:MAG: HDOD domain-containing protein [bacterium]|nr:HDOD domain-containing protein [bacterium]MCS7308773.1 HDOD domain-containing protein [Armatimonadota bacterium]
MNTAAAPEKLQQLVQTIRDLPALPEVVVRVMRMTEDPRTDAQSIARVIATDQAMAARVLKLANSAFYGLPRRVSTLSEAVVILGFRTIKNLAIAASTFELLNREIAGYWLQRGELWRHSLACAIGAQLIARRVRLPVVEEAFVAGLLHDIGKVAINLFVREQFDQIMECALKERIAFVEAEQAVLGFNHAMAGGLIAEKWNLPPSLVAVIKYHHQPSSAPEREPMISIVHLADVLSITLGIGIGGDGLYYHFEEDTLAMFGLEQADLDDLCEQIVEQMARAASLQEQPEVVLQ